LDFRYLKNWYFSLFKKEYVLPAQAVLLFKVSFDWFKWKFKILKGLISSILPTAQANKAGRRPLSILSLYPLYSFLSTGNLLFNQFFKTIV